MWRSLTFAIVVLLMLIPTACRAPAIVPSVQGQFVWKGKIVELKHVYAHWEDPKGRGEDELGVLLTDRPVDAATLGEKDYREAMRILLEDHATQGIYIGLGTKGAIWGSLYHADSPRGSFADFGGGMADRFTLHGSGVKVKHELDSDTVGGWSFSVSFEAPLREGE